MLVLGIGDLYLVYFSFSFYFSPAEDLRVSQLGG